MTKATIFTNNKSQAVRLPKDVALPDTVKRVEIIKLGKTRLIAPVGISWDSFFDSPVVSEDFMNDRQQPSQQRREGF